MKRAIHRLALRLHERLAAGVRRSDGTASLDFVLVLPLMFSIFLASVDFGVTMLRQVFLERAVDMAIREVRLGRIGNNGAGALSELICARTTMMPNCSANIAVEMFTADPENLSGLNDPTQCISAEQALTPALSFTAGASHELMVVRVCVSADPFIRMTGHLGGLPINAEGDYQLTARAVFVNEPRGQ